MLVSAAVVAYPFLVPPFWVVNIGAYAVVLVTITLILTFLAAYGEMVSLAQMSVAGISGYILAVLSPHAATIGTTPLWPRVFGGGFNRRYTWRLTSMHYSDS